MSYACDIAGVQPKPMGTDHTPGSPETPTLGIAASYSSAVSTGALETYSASLALSHAPSSGLAYIGETIRQTLGVNSLVEAQSQISKTFKTLASPLGPAEKLLEEERMRRERLIEALDPARGLKEALQSISSIQMPGQVIQEMVQRLDPNFQLDRLQHAIAAQFAAFYGISGPATASGDAITVHATQATPAERRSAPSARTAKKGTLPRSAQHDNQSLSQNSEEGIEPTLAWDQQRDLSKHEASITIHRFIERQDAPSDPRVGLKATAMWCAQNQHRLHPAEGQTLNLLLQAYLCERHGKSAPPHIFKVLNSGLLIPAQDTEQRQLDLDPTVYTTQQLAKEVSYSVYALKRLAAKALNKGTLPQPLEECPGWFVVQASDPRGGSGCGWKFQHLRQNEDTSQNRSSKLSTIRTTQIHPSRHH